MEQAERASTPGRLQFAVLFEPDERTVCVRRPERRRGGAAALKLKPKHPQVVVQRSLEVSNLQPNGANANRLRQPESGRDNAVRVGRSRVVVLSVRRCAVAHDAFQVRVADPAI